MIVGYEGNKVRKTVSVMEYAHSCFKNNLPHTPNTYFLEGWIQIFRDIFKYLLINSKIYALQIAGTFNRFFKFLSASYDILGT